MNIDSSRPEFEQSAEFNSRITYLSFKDEASSSLEFNSDMVNRFGHRSVYNDQHVTFLIAGVSLETCLEFVAHREATVARLTSSKTKSQIDTLYRVFSESQKESILKFIEFKNNVSNIGDTEIDNMFNLSSKAISFTITMSIKDWHKTLIGRLSNIGVEKEVIEVSCRIALELKNEFPLVFNTIEEYFATNNDAKYSD
jgi:hypothetical protein